MGSGSLSAWACAVTDPPDPYSISIGRQSPSGPAVPET